MSMKLTNEIREPEMIELTHADFPNIHKALCILEADSGMPVSDRTIFDIPIERKSELPILEAIFATMDGEKMEILCAGEQSEMEAITNESPEMKNAGAFLEEYFNDWIA